MLARKKLGKRLRWLPVVTAVLGFLCAALFNSVRTPVYEAITNVASFYGDTDVLLPYEELVQISPIVDDVARRLELPGGSSELTSAVQIKRPGYNYAMVHWVEGWRWRLPGIIANWVPRPPPPPRHNMEIRVRHIDPVMASQIGSTFVDAYNEYSLSIREEFIVTQIAGLATKIHTTVIELALAMEKQNAKSEQAALRNKLEVLLANLVSLAESLPLEATSPLVVVETPTVPLVPIHSKRNLLVGTTAGALVGFILYVVKGKQRE